MAAAKLSLKQPFGRLLLVTRVHCACTCFCKELLMSAMYIWPVHFGMPVRGRGTPGR